MKIKYLSSLCLLFSLCLGTAYGQWDAQISQYWRVKSYYNPSFAGETDNIENTLLHRQQWVGITNAPTTSMAMMNMPIEFLGKKHAVGFVINNEKIGLFSNTTTGGQYSYKFQFKNKKILSIGLQASLANISFDANQIHIPDSEYHDPNDPAKPSGGSDKTYDAGLGISWTTPSYYAGLSVTHLWNPTFDLDATHASYMARTYYLIGGYNIKANSALSFNPSTLLKSDGTVTQVDVTARVEYNKIVNGGISWRKDDGFVFLLGIKIRDFDAGYAYDLSTSEIARVSSGSHELFLRYSIPIHKSTKKGSYKSVRIL